MPLPSPSLLPGLGLLPGLPPPPPPATLSPLGEEWLTDLPHFYRDDPDVRAVIRVQAREWEMIHERLEQVRRQFFPQHADLLLDLWERELYLPVAPAGLTVEQRQDRAVARMRRIGGDASGLGFIANVTALLNGNAFSYLTHDPADDDGPPPDTIWLFVPYEPGSSEFIRVDRDIVELVDATVEVVVSSTGGFLLGASLLGDELL